MEHSHSCGHRSIEPRNMGRGAARIRRLAEFYSKTCLECAIARVTYKATLYTDIKGKPLTGDALKTITEKDVALIIRQYPKYK